MVVVVRLVVLDLEGVVTVADGIWKASIGLDKVRLG